MTRGRWLELGALEPAPLHAAYAGIARAQPVDGPPFVVRAGAASGHLVLGATQAAGEADLAACRARGWGPWRRPLGGGAVWVDAEQHPFFIGLPGGDGRRGEAEAAILEALAATHRAFGLPATVVGRDVWVGDRKVVGTGSATVGRTWLLGAALLWRLPVRRFARAVAAPSAGYRRWLARELAAGLSSWEDHAPRPPAPEVDVVLATELGRRLGVAWAPDGPTAAERDAIREEEAEVRAEAGELEPDEPSR
ncbi:MAG: lipoyl protein ligase domain-containing protein, partial [Thiohalospira sp.]